MGHSLLRTTVVLVILASCGCFAQLASQGPFIGSLERDLRVTFGVGIPADPFGSGSQVSSSVFGGVTLARFTLAPCGFRALHSHPRAAELAVVTRGGPIQGGLLFENNTFEVVNLRLNEGVLFPTGLNHWLYNPNCEAAEYYNAFANASPGTVTLGAQVEAIPSQPRSASFNVTFTSLRFTGPFSRDASCVAKCVRGRRASRLIR